MRRPFSISEYDPWSRHSICSLEGDILISNIESPDRGNDDYLIPSLLLLKQKVDLVFGSQPIISLSNDRKGVTVDVCSDSIGKEKFRLYAESIVKKKDISNGLDVSSLIDTTSSLSMTPLSIQPSPLVSMSFLTPQPSSSIPTPSLPSRLSLPPPSSSSSLLPSSVSPVSTYRRLHFVSAPPLRTHLDSLLANYNQPPCFYDTLGVMHEFDTISYLQSLGLLQPFWKEMLSQQISLPLNQVFRRYHYSSIPPRLSDDMETTLLDESLDMLRKSPPQLCSFPSLTQSSLTQTQIHSHDKPELRLFNLELICESEVNKKPNPRNDQIIATFYSYSISYSFIQSN